MICVVDKVEGVLQAHDVSIVSDSKNAIVEWIRQPCTNAAHLKEQACA